MGNSSPRSAASVFSSKLRSGKKTYFFDVRATRKNEYYLTITESIRNVDSTGKFVYNRNKIFLRKEQFAGFIEELEKALDYIKSAKGDDYGLSSSGDGTTTTRTDSNDI